MLAPAGVGALVGIPEPVIHDEFSYLLGADTIVRGRLTNPSPPLPEFFETPHVLVVPSYNSKYPPGQAVFLAVGQLVGQPIAGVWLSCGAFAASLCWMLQAWSSRKWALAITVLMIATLGTSSYWAQSYWGGMVPATGSALLLGGLRRTLRRPSASAGWLMALGVLILANTRPYEGLLLCGCAAWACGVWLVRRGRHSVRATLTHVAAPFFALLIVGGGFMLRYNHAITGQAWRTPYGQHLDQYFHQGVFLFSPIRKPERTPTARIASFYQSNAAPPEHGTTLISHALQQALTRFTGTLETAFGFGDAPRLGRGPNPYRGGLLWLALLVAVWAHLSIRLVLLAGLAASLAEASAWRFVPIYPLGLSVPVMGAWLLAFVVAARRDVWTRFIMTTVLMAALGQAIVWWWWPHYAAPILPLVLAATASTARRMARRVRDGGSHQPLAWVLVVLLSLHVATLAVVHGFSAASGGRSGPVGLLSRGEAMSRLDRLGGRHLVFVRYTPEASIHIEWVYNRADLDTASVIVAHDFGPSRNAGLIAAFPERSTWMATVSVGGARLDRYSAGSTPP